MRLPPSPCGPGPVTVAGAGGGLCCAHSAGLPPQGEPEAEAAGAAEPEVGDAAPGAGGAGEGPMEPVVQALSGMDVHSVARFCGTGWQGRQVRREVGFGRKPGLRNLKRARL